MSNRKLIKGKEYVLNSDNATGIFVCYNSNAIIFKEVNDKHGYFKDENGNVQLFESEEEYILSLNPIPDTEAHGIGEASLRELYCLSFHCVVTAIRWHYAKKSRGAIDVVVKHNCFHIMKDGKLFETVSMKNIDAIFEKVDVQTLRKGLKRMV